jgi:hypothetical protein
MAIWKMLKTKMRRMSWGKDPAFDQLLWLPHKTVFQQSIVQESTPFNSCPNSVLWSKRRREKNTFCLCGKMQK